MLILGSNSFYLESTRNKISDLIKDKSGKMLIIPLACSFELETGNKEKNCAVMAGFKNVNIFVYDHDYADELLSVNYDYIVVLGGNTFKLLYYIREYGLDKFIRKQVENNAVYLGFSAGAYLACPDIEYVNKYDKNYHINNNDFNALNLTDKYVICHYDSRGMQEMLYCCSKLNISPEQLIPIKETDIIVLDN